MPLSQFFFFKLKPKLTFYIFLQVTIAKKKNSLCGNLNYYSQLYYDRFNEKQFSLLTILRYSKVNATLLIYNIKLTYRMLLRCSRGKNVLKTKKLPKLFKRLC